ncbi:MAG: TonB-dependent receptor [Myxococcota bacterium]
MHTCSIVARGWILVGLCAGAWGVLPAFALAVEPAVEPAVELRPDVDDGADATVTDQSSASAPVSTEPTGPGARALPRAVEPTDTRVITVKTTTGDGLTATSHRIDAATLSTTPKRTAEDLMRLVPGMLVVQHGNQGKGYQYYIRGFDAVHGADVEVLVDDVPMNESSNVHAHGYLDMSFIVPEVVQGLEVKKGSVRLEQGPFATAGSVEYQLGVPGPLRGTTVGYEFGSTGRHRAAVVHAPRDRGEETFVAATAFHDDGYGQNRRAEGVSTLGKARLWQGQGAFVDALGGLYAARFGLPGTLRLDDYNRGRVGFYDAYLHDTRGESARALVAVKAGVERDRGRLVLTGYAKARSLELDENFTGFSQSTRPNADVNVDPDWGDRHVQRQESVTAGLRAEGRWQVHDRVELRLVGRYEGGVVDQRNDLVTPQGQTWSTDRDLLIEQHGFGLGPGVGWRALDWLRIEGGLRVEGYHAQVRDRGQARTFSGTAWTLAPRVATQALLGARWQLFAAYGRGFRPPEARAFTRPEQVAEGEDADTYRGGLRSMTVADNAEVGARWKLDEIVDVGGALFGTFIARESVFDHVSGFNVELGATRRLGFEADVQVRPAPWLGLGVSLVGSHARFVETGDPVPGAPPLIAQLNGTLLHPKGLRAGLRGLVMGRRPLSYGATAGALATIDASVGYQWRRFQADLYVDNVLGTRWRDGEYHYASYWDRDQPRQGLPTIHFVAGPPRMFRVAGSIRF